MFRHARTEEPRDTLWLKLDVPAERVLLTGFDAWHSVLNGFPGGAPDVPDPSDEDWDAYLDQDWSAEELGDTWRSCLDLNGERSIQASFWTLRPEDVTKVFLKGSWRPLEAVLEG